MSTSPGPWRFVPDNAPEMAELLRKLASPEVERSIERMADHDCEANPTILDEDIDRLGAICREARVLVGRGAPPAAPETAQRKDRSR